MLVPRAMTDEHAPHARIAFGEHSGRFDQVDVSLDAGDVGDDERVLGETESDQRYTKCVGTSPRSR